MGVQKEINNADSHMTVQSLTVIKGIKNAGIATIKKEIQGLKQSTAQFTEKQNEYWKSFSSDGVISTSEKQILKKEWGQIDLTFSNIIKLANDSDLQDTNDVNAYKEQYYLLYTYLFETLKLFDDMTKPTSIENREIFNTYYANYYAAETEIQTKLLIGMVDVQGMRVLENLTGIGVEKEVAVYLGQLYQYSNGQWTAIPTDGYLGIKDACPVGAIGQFFLSGTSDFYYPIKIKVNGKYLKASNGDFIVATKKVEKGFIYTFTETGWVKVINKNDYRYVIALNDLLEIGEKLPANLQDVFDEKIDHVPCYLGSFSIDPKDAQEGDWYTYNGVTTTLREKGQVYLYQMNTAGTALSWVKLNPEDVNNSSYFMASLKDVLETNAAGPGYFTTVFCNAFFSNTASITSLQTQTISLKDDGLIKSGDSIYEQYKSGMCIDAAGNADFNRNTHIGGNLQVDGVTTLGNDTRVLGNAWFLGRIDSGPLYLADEDPSSAASQEVLSGYNTMDFFNWCNSKGEGLTLGSAQGGKIGLLNQQFNGTVGGVAFSLVYWMPNSSASAGYFSFQKKDGTEVLRRYLDNWTDKYDSIPDIILNLYTPGARTLRLKDLPTSPGVISGVVYVTTEGYLRVTL